MLRDIKEYAELGVGHLLTLKTLLVQFPRKVLRSINRFIIWFTGDYDIGYILFNAWLIWFLYLLADIVQTYTNFFGNCMESFIFIFNAFFYIIALSTWFFFHYWLPIIVVLVLGLGTAHLHYKKHREIHEMMWSYVDDEEDIPVNICEIRPQPLNCRGWGARDEDVETVQNFVAPTKYIKISGMVGMIPGMTIPDNIARMNQSLKDKLVPGVVNGPYPWVKVTVDTRVGLVYVKFKTIEDATHCFNTLDGYSFDVDNISSKTERKLKAHNL